MFRYFIPSSLLWTQCLSSALHYQWSTVTYNCQALPPARPLQTVLQKLNRDVVALQGTRSRWGWPEKHLDQSFYTKTVGKYFVVTWPYNYNSPAVNDHCGVIIAVNKKLPKSAVKHTFSPPAWLEGRAGAIRVRLRKGPDFTFSNIHCPPSSFPNAALISQQLWSWAEDVLAQLPSRTLPVFLLDANARLGSTILFSPEGHQQVGPYTNQRENSAGRSMRHFLEKTNWAALKSIFPSSRGHTWFNTRGHSSCVDYVLSTTTSISTTVDIRILRSLGHKLQLPSSDRLADHVPVAWTFWHPRPLPGQRLSCAWSRPLVDTFVSDPSSVQTFCADINAWASDEDTLASLATAEANQDVDQFWRLINDKVADNMQRWEPHRLLIRFPAESPTVVALLDRRCKLKDQLNNVRLDEIESRDLNNFLRHQLQIIHQDIRREREQSWNTRQQRLSDSILFHSRRQNWRRAWQAARNIAQMGIGPKGRVYHHTSAYRPSVVQWLVAMAADGSQGGCKARTMWYSDLDEFMRDLECYI